MFVYLYEHMYTHRTLYSVSVTNLARIFLLLYWNVICDPSLMCTKNEYFSQIDSKVTAITVFLWTEWSARQVFVLLHTGQWWILVMIVLTPVFFIILMLFLPFLSMFKVKLLPLTDITQHSNFYIFWDQRDAGWVLIFLIFCMEKPFFVGQAICRLPTIQYSSNGNASETKANESIDNGVFFDIEAKQTPSIVRKLFSKRSEHIR